MIDLDLMNLSLHLNPRYLFSFGVEESGGEDKTGSRIRSAI